MLVNEAADGVDLVVNDHEKVLYEFVVSYFSPSSYVTRCPFPKPSTALHVERYLGGDLNVEFVEDEQNSNTFLVLWPLTSV